MANCGVKRDLESSYVHFQNSVRSVFSKISIEVLHSSSCNRVFRTEFILCVRLVRATISGAETNPDSQRMSIKMNPDLFTQTAREGSEAICLLRRIVRFDSKL